MVLDVHVVPWTAFMRGHESRGASCGRVTILLSGQSQGSRAKLHDSTQSSACSRVVTVHDVANHRRHWQSLGVLTRYEAHQAVVDVRPAIVADSSSIGHVQSLAFVGQIDLFIVPTVSTKSMLLGVVTFPLASSSSRTYW